MAVIDVVIQPDGCTRVWFDCRDARPRPEPTSGASSRRLRHALADARSRMDQPQTADRDQAASARSTRRPVTLPSRSRISASLAWLCGTVATGSAGSVPSCASFTSSRSSFGLPT